MKVVGWLLLILPQVIQVFLENSSDRAQQKLLNDLQIIKRSLVPCLEINYYIKEMQESLKTRVKQLEFTQYSANKIYMTVIQLAKNNNFLIGFDKVTYVINKLDKNFSSLTAAEAQIESAMLEQKKFNIVYKLLLRLTKLLQLLRWDILKHKQNNFNKNKIRNKKIVLLEYISVFSRLVLNLIYILGFYKKKPQIFFITKKIKKYNKL